MGRTRLTLAAFVAVTAVAALAGSGPSLEIQSPKQNATLPGNVVIIKFRTHDFRVVSLRDMLVSGAVNANASRGAVWSSSGPVLSGMSNAPDIGNPAAATETSPVLNGYDGGAPRAGNGGSLPVNPHEGFVDVLVDNAHFYFVHSTSDPILLAGLAPGPHRVTLRLVTDDHHPTGAAQTLIFTVAPDPGTVHAPQH